MTSAGNSPMVASKLLPFGIRHARRRLIEQQHLRPAGESERDLKEALLAVRQDCRALMHDVGEAKALDDLDDLVRDHRFAADQPPPVAAEPEPFGDRKPDRFKRRQIQEQLIDLERARHAEPHALMRTQRRNVVAAKDDPAGGRPQHAGEQIDHRGLAGAVRPDQSVPRALLDRQRNVMRGDDAAEALFQADRFEDRHGSTLPSARRRRRPPAASPAACRADRSTARNAAVQLSARSRPTSTMTTSTKPIQNCQYCGVRLAIQSCRNL